MIGIFEPMPIVLGNEYRVPKARLSEPVAVPTLMKTLPELRK